MQLVYIQQEDKANEVKRITRKYIEKEIFENNS